MSKIGWGDRSRRRGDGTGGVVGCRWNSANGGKASTLANKEDNRSSSSSTRVGVGVGAEIKEEEKGGMEAE